MDSESQALLDAVIESLPTARILLLISYRPEYQHGWGKEGVLHPPRDRAAAARERRRAAHWTPGPGRDARVPQAHVDRADPGQPLLPRGERAGSGGEPRARRGSGSLSDDEGARGVADPGDGSGDRRGANRPVATRGEGSASGGVRHRAGRAVRPLEIHRRCARDEPPPGLTSLETAEFLYETSLVPDLEYTFKQTLTHEVAYASMLQERRRALHARIVEALETLSPDRLTEQVERLAHHAFRGEVWQKAVTYLRQAGAKALALSAYREAVSRFEQALTALHRLPDTRRDNRACDRRRLDLRQALFPLDELTRVLGYLQRSGTTGANARRSATTRMGVGVHEWPSPAHRQSRHRRAPVALTVEAIGERLGDGRFTSRPSTTSRRLVPVWRLSRGGGGCRTLVQSLPDPPRRERFGLAVFPAVVARAHLARTLAECGVFDEGDAHGHEAIRIAEALDHPFSVVVACLDLAYLKSVQGGAEPGRPSARACGRSVPRVEHHDSHADRHGVRWGTCTRGRDVSRRASPACSRR